MDGAGLPTATAQVDAREPGAPLARLLRAATPVATVVHREAKIGDSLCTLPALLALAGLLGREVAVRGAFCPAVAPLLRHLPLRFEPAPAGNPLLEFRLDIQRVYQDANQADEHMAAGFCRHLGLPLPALPEALPLAAEDIGLPAGIVLSPFSGSANGWYKVWPTDRWLALADRLAQCHPDLPLYVIGGADDDMSPYAAAGPMPLPGLALPEVLGLLRAAAAVISIDNGISHLAHFGAVARHVLLYPALLAPALVANPRARILRAAPEAIGVDQVWRETDALLSPALAG